ncbi:MAG: CRISPR-associated endonuclease Cas1 [Proteobacteria bacterium]|nr:CRISPR-associated endonuclease Cas1 [Pseudomonadota bacterium]
MVTTKIIYLIKWYKLTLELEKIRQSSFEREIPQVVIHSIVKEISSNKLDNIFFHIKNHTFGERIRKGESITVEIIIPTDNRDLAEEINKRTINYLNTPSGGRNYKLIDTFLEKRGYDDIFLGSSFDFEAEETTLEFLTPLHFRPLEEHHRTYLDKSTFIKFITKRLKRLFDLQVEFSEDMDITIIPYYWQYKEKVHYSKSQIGTHQLINGCVGKLYLRGDLKEILPFLILCSELHLGTKISFSYGYYKLHTPSIPFLDETFQNSVKLKQTFLAVTNIPEGTKIIIDPEKYYPQPNMAERVVYDGREYIKEYMNPIDKVYATFTSKVLSDYNDRILSNTTYSYRKNVSQLDAIKKINEHLEDNGYYVLITEIERLYSSIDIEMLWYILDGLIPMADRKFRKILSALIFNGYTLDGAYHKREYGLVTISPLSPVLSNIYLNVVDLELKNIKDISFLRYAGNYIFFSDTSEKLENLLEILKEKLRSLNLFLNVDNTILKKATEGFTFLGHYFQKKDSSQEETKIYKKTLYINDPSSFLSISDESIEIYDEKKQVKTIPLRRIKEIIIEDNATFSTALLKKTSQFNIPISISLKKANSSIIISPNKREFYNSIHNHILSYSNLEDFEKINIAREIVKAKIKSYITLYSSTPKIESKETMEQLKEHLKKVDKLITLEEIRGYEGRVSRIIFSLFSDHTKADEFKITKRDRLRKDYINTLLNFGYHLLFVRINMLVRSKNLNPYLGFLHYSTDDYEQFVCDIQEIFRARIDKIILKLINKGMIKPNHFKDENDRYLLDSAAKKKFILEYESEMHSKHHDNLTLLESMEKQVEYFKSFFDSRDPLKYLYWKI